MDWISIAGWIIPLFVIGWAILAFIAFTKEERSVGCGCSAAFGFLLLFTFILAPFQEGILSWQSACLSEREKQSKEEDAKKTAELRIAEDRQRQVEKEEKLQTFALKDAHRVWEVYQSLQCEIEVQNGKIEELRTTLKDFDKIPEQDEDFKAICALRDEMIHSRDVLRTKLEDAYLAAKKYEASPSRKDYEVLHKKALEDGILEADQAEAKFKEMRMNK